MFVDHLFLSDYKMIRQRCEMVNNGGMGKITKFNRTKVTFQRLL